MSTYPVLLHTAIGAVDCRGLAELYCELLGLSYRDRDKPPTDGSPDEADWIALLDDNGNRVMTIQRKVGTTPPTWPSETPLLPSGLTCAGVSPRSAADRAVFRRRDRAVRDTAPGWWGAVAGGYLFQPLLYTSRPNRFRPEAPA